MKSWLAGDPDAITRAPRAMRELDRDVADAARPAGDEQILAAAQAERVEAWCAVSAASGSAAASSKDSRRGMWARKPSGTVVNSA